MIFVRRDPSMFPADLLAEASDAQRILEGLPEGSRAEFIKKNAGIWRKFKEHLSKMSYGKCWYSEMPVDQTFHDVDHFRPKLKARRSPSETDRGYEWLAFSPENFRLAAQRSNRLSTNEETDETEGKGDWFPLLEGSPRASWVDRCETRERPVLLDPIQQEDVELVEVGADGRMKPSQHCFGINRRRVQVTVELLGLDLPNLVAARKRVMRTIEEMAEILAETMVQSSMSDAFADSSQMSKMRAALKRKTSPKEPYSAAARAQLRFKGFPDLVQMPEEWDGTT